MPFTEVEDKKRREHKGEEKRGEEERETRRKLSEQALIVQSKRIRFGFIFT